jgi:ketosteroid isomerase-like protein
MSDDSSKLDVLERMLDGFNRRDLEAIMSLFAEDCVFDAPRGPDPWGRRFEGKEAVADGLGARLTGIPDVSYEGHGDFVSGERGASEWTLGASRRKYGHDSPARTEQAKDAGNAHIRGDMGATEDAGMRRFAAARSGVYFRRGALRGTTIDGERLDVRGCDLWTFRGDQIVRKDSYWKIVER